jgi:hypothetical protein
MTVRRMATIATGAAIIVVGDVVGGYGGAAVIGLGIGVAIVGVGRREPWLLRRRHEDEEPRDPGASRWSQW